MSRFSDYLASQITPQMTLLEKFNLMIKFLQENNYISIFYSQENYNIQTGNYQKEKVNLNGFTLHIGDCIVFSNGYYAFVETIGVNTFTIGNVLYFQGQQGVSVIGATISSGHLILTLSDGENIDAGNLKGVSNFSINSSQHLIVNYQDGTNQDLGAIFNGNVNIDGNFTANSIIENMEGYSFTTSEKENLTKEILYAGVVKNGNKLTLCVYAKLKRTGTVEENNISLGQFGIPYLIGTRLYPAVNNWLEFKRLYCGSNYNSGEEVNGLVIKSSNILLTFIIYDINNKLTEDVDYYCRFETTFLLSENLAS